MENPQQTVTLSHVWAEEPNAVRLRINRLLLPVGERRAYARGEECADAPLAAAVLAVEGVTSLQLESSLITVFMTEDADWDPIIERVCGVIVGHVEAGLSPVTPPAPKKKYSFGFKQVDQRAPDEQKRIVQQVFDAEINPAVASHGGHFTLIDVKDNTVYVQLGGGCQGCGMVDVTLRQGVEARLREVLPEMAALVDVTDHAAGSNPYYQPGK